MPKAIAFINPRLTTRNVGDLFIEDSVKRILVYDRRRSIDVDPRRPITSDDIRRINETDAAVIVGTNLWYRSLPGANRWCFTTSQLRQIRVPIIPLGVGTTRHAGDDNGFDAETLAQLRMIHASCALASARDVRTAEALDEAGIRNVAMTGCPTLYRSLQPRWQLRTNDKSRRVAVTVRHGHKRNAQLLIDELLRRGFEPTVAAQQEKDLFMQRSFSLFRPSIPTLYEYDVEPYLDLVEEGRGAIGWRLHGDMLHLAHGRPAGFFANCSRSSSFCDSFGLPAVAAEDHQRLQPRAIVEAVDRWLDPATYAELPARYASGRSEMRLMLAANGLEHNLATDSQATSPRAAA
ncbi:MAG: polysaccharide pyruvyl transferase family protein [Pirellulales bacterium]|nr:polysaccharide pyruvyl transferase family protein [Planctomycetales bacterium]